MDGITILTSSIVEKENPFFHTIAMYFLIPFIIFLILMCIYATKCKDTLAGICAFLFGLFGLSSIGFEIAAQKLLVPAYTKYEVILDDSVSVNEFMEKYEVLEQRDKIYVIKEKEIEN